MADIVMDTSATESMLNDFRSRCDAVKQEMASSMSRCSALVGTGWIAGSATEFQNEFSQLRQRLDQLSEQWALLNNRLQGEIVQWRETQARLAAGSAG